MASKKKSKSNPTSENGQSTRVFGIGESVRVSKKSRVVDKDRAGEGSPPGTLEPIDQDVTGLEGEVIGPAYESPLKDGAHCVPIKLANEAVIGVPVDRLERPRGVSNGRSGYDPAYERGYDRAFRGSKKKR